MKVTNMKLLTYVNILNKYADKKLPQKISYAITKNLMGLDTDFKCYSKELNKVLSHYEDNKYDSLSGLEIFDLMTVLCKKEEKE